MKRYMPLFFAAAFAVLLFTSCHAALTPSDFASELKTPGLTLRAQYEVYAKDIEKITFLLHNSTSDELCYGEQWRLERKENDGWYVVPYKKDAAWIDLAYLLSPGGTNACTLSLSQFDHRLKNGVYRAIKAVDADHVAAEFTVGPSPVSASSPYGCKPLEKLPADYGREEAVAEGAAVYSNGGNENGGAAWRFFSSVGAGASDMLRSVRFTVEGDPVITDIIYEYVEGIPRITLRTDDTRDAFAHGAIATAYYSFFVTDGEHFYLSNHTSVGEDAVQLYFGGDPEYESRAVDTIAPRMVNYGKSSIATYRLWSPDGESSVALTSEPLGFGFAYAGHGETRTVADKSGICTKIKEVVWTDGHTVLLVCDTTEDGLSYYEWFDLSKAEVVSYTVSRYGYKVDGDGNVYVPE